MKIIKTLKKLAFSIIFFVPNYILETWLFEFRSWLGRTFTGSLKIDPANKNYINLGCGGYIFKEFINIDFYFEPGKDYGADLRYPLKIQDECVDGILCEHTMEHLTYSHNAELMKECYRILKPGGVIRIIVPDVSLFAKNYVEDNREWFAKYEAVMLNNTTSEERNQREFHTPMQAISFVTQEYHHVACWDYETMKFYLEKSGFVNIEKVEHRQGRKKELLFDTDEAGRIHVSLYVEATKP